MARRGENIYKRKDGRYEGRYPKGRKPDGRIKYGYIYGYRYKEVKEQLAAMKAFYGQGCYKKADFRGSFRSWADYWVCQVKQPYIKESTYASYRNKLDNHVLPFLGDKALEKVTADDLQRLAVQMQEKGLLGSSIQVTFRIIDSILQKAVDRHFLYCNPCREVELPKAAKSKKRALSLAEQKRLEQAAIREPGCSPVILGSYTGMRVGEISGLKWEDIDLAEGQLRVRRTMQRIPDYQGGGGSKTKVISAPPKSQASERTIPLSPALLAYLKECRARAKGDYVVSCSGSYAEPRVIQYRFQKLAEGLGIKGTSFHSLRHTFATRCLEERVDIATISTLLGHASVKMTLDTYTGSMYEKQKEAMDCMDAVFKEMTS